jgi:hypothetical protein
VEAVRGKGEMFLVRLDRDVRIQKIVKRPIEIVFLDEDGGVSDVELVEKTAIVCDLCNSQVAVEESELDSLPAGYVLCDGEYIYEVVCEDCRKRCFPRLKIYNDLEEALGER